MSDSKGPALWSGMTAILALWPLFLPIGAVAVGYITLRDRVTTLETDSAQRQALNIPNRVTLLEQAQINQVSNNLGQFSNIQTQAATLAAQVRDINTALAAISQQNATIAAQIQFLIAQSYPGGDQAGKKR
jgi:hypothetical protein